MESSIKTVFAVAMLLCAACGGDKAASPQSAEGSADPAQGVAATAAAYKVSTRNDLQWKRAAVVEADLARALELSTDELCKELSDKNCIRDVHLVPLGGNEPYVSGLMKPSQEPLATTPAVLDRVLLSACSTRANRDAEGPAKIFGKLDFDQPLPAADDPAISASVVELYHRFLAREPSKEELALVASLADASDADNEALSVRDFAALACFTVGSSTEFLFY